MWLLRREKVSDDDQECSVFYLLPGRKYIVGRKDCDIILSGDATISRKHAIISVKVNTEGPSNVSICNTSKTGVTLNEQKLPPKEEIEISDNDTIMFGKMHLKFQFIYRNFNVVTSCVKRSEQKTLLQLLSRLGGKISKEWNDQVTHLVMNKIVFTIKVVYALACGVFIVTPKYFEELLDCSDQKIGKPLPKEKNYLPNIEESSMLNMEPLFFPNEKRTKLFEGKIFVFLSKTQFSRMQEAVTLSGGLSQLQEEKDNKFLNSIVSKQWIILKSEVGDESEMSQSFKRWTDELSKTLTRNGLRTVGESEIGLALINCSMEKFCNPAVKNVDVFCTTTDTQAMHSQNTQSQVPLSVTIPFSAQGKRKRHDVFSSDDNSSSNETTAQKKSKANSHEEKLPTKVAPVGKKLPTKFVSVEENVTTKVASFGEKLPSNVASVGDISVTNQTTNIIDIDDDDDFNFEESSITRTYHSPRKQAKEKLKKNDTLPNKKEEEEETIDILPNKKKGSCILPMKTENIIEIDDDDDDDFNFDDVSFTPSVKPNNNGDASVLAKNTELISPKEKTERFSSKHVVPETVANTTTTVYDSFDGGDQEDDGDANPFAFNVKETSSLNSSRKTRPKANAITEDIDEDSLANDLLDETEKRQRRFNKAALDSQASDCLLSDIDETNFNNVTGDLKNDVRDDDSVTGDLEDDLDIDDPNLVSLETPKMATDMLVSEEFPMVTKKHSKILDGWLTTTCRISSELLKDEEELGDEPRDLMKTAFMPLVANGNKNNKTQHHNETRKTSNGKNTKLFKKQFVIREESRLHMIKSSDLQVYVSNNEEKENAFDSFRQEYEHDDEEQKKITQMFAKI